ncbi:MAG: hypothetical protein HQ564_05075 [Candidatus Saganbacteria bacterium]|nr:hypothetical protein [Candidatus Saganbacteria bacterium]
MSTRLPAVNQRMMPTAQKAAAEVLRGARAILAPVKLGQVPGVEVLDGFERSVRKLAVSFGLPSEISDPLVQILEGFAQLAQLDKMALADDLVSAKADNARLQVEGALRERSNMDVEEARQIADQSLGHEIAMRESLEQRNESLVVQNTELRLEVGGLSAEVNPLKILLERKEGRIVALREANGSLRNRETDLTASVREMEETLRHWKGEHSNVSTLLQEAREHVVRLRGSIHTKKKALSGLRQRFSPLEKKAEALEARRVVLSRELKQKRVIAEKVPSLEREVERKSAELSELEAQISDGRQELAQARQRIEVLDAEVLVMTTTLADQGEQLEELENLREMLKNLEDEVIPELLLELQSVRELSDRTQAALTKTEEDLEGLREGNRGLIGAVEAEKDATTEMAGRLRAVIADDALLKKQLAAMERLADSKEEQNVASIAENEQLSEEKEGQNVALIAENEQLRKDLDAAKQALAALAAASEEIEDMTDDLDPSKPSQSPEDPRDKETERPSVEVDYGEEGARSAHQTVVQQAPEESEE